MSFASQLNKQMYGNKFTFLETQLGADLVASIPNVEVAPFKWETDYPNPWEKPENLPADVVKGVYYPSNRPFLAMRYRNIKTNTLALEIFFQRYSTQKPAAANVIKFDAFRKEGVISQILLPADGLSSNWSSVDENAGGEPIHSSGGVNSKMFAIVKNILMGAPLKDTEGRYLPLHAEKLSKEIAAGEAERLAKKAALDKWLAEHPIVS